MWKRIHRTSGSLGARVAVAAVLVTALIPLAGCNYSFRAGQGFPEHIRTIAVLPFENETTRFELTTELFTAMSGELPRQLGIRTSAPEGADAVVRGTILSYTLGAPLYRSEQGGDRAQVLQREVQIVVTVEILDIQENMILWEEQRLLGQAAYDEGVGSEEGGREEAIELLVQKIADGANSNW
jgi:hypothetical protein